MKTYLRVDSACTQEFSAFFIFSELYFPQMIIKEGCPVLLVGNLFMYLPGQVEDGG